MRILAIIPARGGSKGLPGKNIRSFMGLPLIAHSILCAKMVPEIIKIVVSTDSPEIAAVARTQGIDVPSLRPVELARDDTPMIPVLQHALKSAEVNGDTFDAVLLLDPTSPGRLPQDVTHAQKLLLERPEGDMVVAVSEPAFNPIWVCMVEKNGLLEKLIPVQTYTRRQDVPTVYRINAALYLFRRDFLLRTNSTTWLNSRIVPLVIPESRAVHIDDIDEFKRWELAAQHGLLELPWLSR
jgi:CMP-N,N'-diacetyllegionaminic acid synthase